MKRKALIKHVRKNGCSLVREGGNQSVYINSAKMKISTIPRHKEIYDNLAKKICKDLEIPFP